MYSARPGLLIGFHGCDKARQEQLLFDPNTIPLSEEPFDWLGHGMYFWENNYDRAIEWAHDKRKKGRITHPAVIGAVLDLSYCCDLQDARYIEMLSAYFLLMEKEYAALGKTVPQNKNIVGDEAKNQLMRFRDCATIEFMHHKIREQFQADIQQQGFSRYKLFDSIRGLFPEGREAYPGAGFSRKSHIQICVRNPNCIKGFFLKREEIDFINQEINRD